LSEPVLLEERRGAVACITLNRPHARNALDTSLLKALSAFWQRFRDDTELRVAIVTGAGDRAFSTGRDLKETAAADASGGRVRYEETGECGYPAAFSLGKPVIAAVNGHCLAAGLADHAQHTGG
jgi:enoyl-CoA hydratase/carnithine racemase